MVVTVTSIRRPLLFLYAKHADVTVAIAHLVLQTIDQIIEGVFARRSIDLDIFTVAAAIAYADERTFLLEIAEFLASATRTAAGTAIAAGGEQ